MEKKTVTIHTRSFKTKEVDQQSFKYQVIIVNSSRTYVLNATEQDLADIAPGCKIIEEGENIAC